MAARKPNDLPERGEVRFSIPGLIIFSVALVLAGGLLGSGAFSHFWRAGSGSSAGFPGKNGFDARSTPSAAPANTPAWGELLTHDIEVERPEEYIASEITTYQVPSWTFDAMSREQAEKSMVACGLTQADAARAVSERMAVVTNNATVVQPDEVLIFSLSPSTRLNLYTELARFPQNHFMQFPYVVPGTNISDWFDASNVDTATVERIRRLLYKRGDTQCFSDFEIIMRGLPSDAERLRLVKALSRQRALLARLRIRPDSDIEKILGYWDRGIQVKDARPLLESVKRIPDGGTISLLYLLPKFARERLYTFPLPPKPDDPAMDCHWTTLNYFNETPDDQFARPEYTAKYVSTNFYRIAKPNQYGDIMFILDEHGNGVHSGVYLADDIVFTKNGNNYAQPWMLMRLKDLLATYSARMPVTTAFYRRNGW